MADSVWVSTDGNMAAAGSYSPSGVPGAGGSLYFNASSSMDAISGMTAITGRLEIVKTLAAYQGDIGADGNAFYVNTKKFIHQGTGSIFYKPVLDVAFATNLVVDSPNLQDAFTLTAGDASGSYRLFVRSGGVRILDNAGDLLRLMVGLQTGTGPFVTIGSGVGDIHEYYQSSGEVVTKSDLGTSTRYCIVDGGKLVYDAAGTASWNRINITGGTVEYNGTGTLSFAVVNSGTLDMTKDSRAKTISSLIIMPGGQFLTHDNITVTSLIDLRPPTPILTNEAI